jgi:amino acid adenylation domain-containing protein
MTISPAHDVSENAPPSDSLLTLRDVSVGDRATPGIAGEPERRDVSRAIDVSDAKKIAVLANALQINLDSIFASAWLLAIDCVLANDRVLLHLLDGRAGGANSIRTSIHVLPKHANVAEWLTDFDRAISAAPAIESRADASEYDYLWLPTGTASGELHAEIPLLIGVDSAPTASPIIRVKYSSLVYGPELIDALLDCMLRVLSAFRDSPHAALSSIDPLGDVQRATLQRWNNSATPFDSARTVHGEFTRVAATAGDRAAIAWGLGQSKKSMSYRELDAMSSALAATLIARGVKPGESVGVAMDRSVEAIAILLAILKAGAAYLPLDTKYPKDRIAFMLGDAQAVHVVARSADAHFFPSAAVLDIATPLKSAANAEQSLSVNQRVNGDSSAYVMYTSGSTGEPKGIEICHKSILRLVCSVDYVRLGKDDAVLHAAPLGFDASTLEIWGPLLNGGTCVLHHESVPTGAGLSATIKSHGVSTAWLTAALFNAIVDDDPKSLEGLDQLLTGGEALSVSHITRCYAALPRITLINGYGPTECTTFTATYRIPRDFNAAERSVPIGRPIPETQVYVVNQRMEVVPIGVVGELVVGGRGLARGYLRRPVLTAERFVESPFAKGEKLYRTGDLVRYLPSGDIEFIGRRDGQVKIRGFRIEVGEIETALSSHNSVRTCAVVARTDAPGDTRLIAYVVAVDGHVSDAVALKTHMSASLPEFMVPSAFVFMQGFPVTANGKLDRRALPKPEYKRPDTAGAYAAPQSVAEEKVCKAFAELLGLDRVGRLDNFFEMGGSSLLVMRAVSRLKQVFPGSAESITATTFFSDPTPAAISAGIEKPHSLSAASDLPADVVRLNQAPNEPIAIIAMTGRFPGAASVEALWENLCAGKDSITFFNEGEIDASVPLSLKTDPDYVKARGVIDGVEMFDAAFFGISPKEAELMDPQQRIFMELCWECLERGGYVPETTGGPVGVFGGMYNATYMQRHVRNYPEKINQLGEFQVMLANEKDYITTRTANRLNLTGPAVSVHTACSTSLVAIAQAVMSLRSGQCRMALAGGASITCPPNSGYLYQDGAMLSPDGRTRTFDKDARGTVFSDGAAMVLLKRLSDAISDGDMIMAVVKGVAINNDGGAKASFTAPSVDGQAAVISAALRDADVPARSIGYVEAHGTATPLGDPVELEALTRAYRRETRDIGFCRIGSVKSNLGHTVIAAGATGVIKTAMALAKDHLPATIHFEAPNSQIDFARSPFTVNSEPSNWSRGAAPRRAGVSSFGVGGTNAHVILEEAPLLDASEDMSGAKLLIFSARSKSALALSMAQMADHLEECSEVNLSDAAHTLLQGRRTFAERACVVAATPQAAVAALRNTDAAERAIGRVAEGVPGVTFMFPGQGAQYAAMGSALYATEPVFREALDDCFAAIRGATEFDLKEKLFSADSANLAATEVTQPALFAIEYSLARLWMSLRVSPKALIGHSVGEFVAATLAGVFSLRDGIRLVAKRGQLMQSQPRGAMLAVRAPVAKVKSRLPANIDIAAENSPALCVVAGSIDAIASLKASLETDGIVSRELQTSHAFHSAMMDAAVTPFAEALRDVKLSAPSLPIYSTVSGRRLSDVDACDPLYWAQHLRATVKFSPALLTAMEQAPGVLLELGPRATLSTLARQHVRSGSGVPFAVATLADAPEREAESFALAAGRLWISGVPVELARLDHRNKKRRVLLPTYPFEKQRYWLDTKASEPAPAQPVAPLPSVMSPLPNQLPLPQEFVMSATTTSNSQPAAGGSSNRVPELVAQLRAMLEETSGIEMTDAATTAAFVELGLDSLSLTQIAIQLKQTFKVNITFRQLMEKYRSLESLATFLDGEMPQVAASVSPSQTPAAANVAAAPMAAVATFAQLPVMQAGAGSMVQQVIQQQMALMAQQLALLQGSPQTVAMPAVLPATSIDRPAATAQANVQDGAQEENATAPMKYDVKKAFGAIARIYTDGADDLTERQRARLDAFMRRYIARTKLSKEYTVKHRPHLADPRVVNGFRPQLKEIIYQIVIGRSKGSRVWDLDGNEYVDVLNGFGMNLFGWQPGFVQEAVQKQLSLGYEIGPQHPLAGEVAKLICDMTGHDRAGLCNTGSEAVMGAVRVARTVTGRNTIALFTGSYHGIFDEVIVRATKKLKAVPAAPGIMANTSQNVIVLDYGTPESMQILKERAHELAAVLVEPVQSRRPDFQPREFLQELREVTQQAGTLLIFDEVVTGFRCHPGGIQSLFGIRADLCTYGKVVGGGFPIGVIAGKREFMDALDGGGWQYGDDSIPTVGVTYFAGTFVRHPLALAAAKAVLEHLKEEGPRLQAELTVTTTAMVDELNAFCRENGAPIVLKSFASVWKTFFTEDHPMQDLLFAMMRSRGVHVLDNFPCFFTSAHSAEDIATIKTAFKESVIELQESGFIPKRKDASAVLFDATKPPVPGARIGKDPAGNPAWFVPNPDSPGKFLRLDA